MQDSLVLSKDSVCESESRKLKILYYNWIQFDNEKNIGGGVNVYQRNLIEYFTKNTEHEVYFLSSGWSYNPFKKKAFIKKKENIFGGKCKSFEIINSSMMAPAYSIFMNPQKFIEDEESVDIFDKFLTQYGDFDVVHINNFEGISVNILKLKEKYPNTKFIVSIHNYQPICPLVQYFQNHNECICHDYKNGEECLKCCEVLPDKSEYYRKIKNYYYEKFNGSFKFLRFPAKLFCKFFKYKSKEYIGSKETMLAEQYARYRKYNIECLNKYADCILAVSERVRSIMIEHGCNPNLVKTSYIGTRFAENELKYSIAQSTQPFTIAYLGYERVDKGFFFLVDALSKLDKSIAQNINIVFAVSKLHKNNIENLMNFNDIIVYNGYSHKELPDILKNVNLGIVPVLWEDNLPQVAIEMVALGVPILCSDFGGASELCTNELFKFKGGDEGDLINHLSMLATQPLLLKEYWTSHPDLTTMEKHANDLLAFYSGSGREYAE